MRHLWQRAQLRLHPPRGIHRAELVTALFLFALPLALVPYAGSVRATAGQPTWEYVAGYAGGQSVQHLAAGARDDTPALYAAGDVSGVMVSGDGGATWRDANAGLPHGRWQSVRLVDLALDAADAGVLYAAVESPPANPRPMLYWSVDGGRHWQPRANLGRERVQGLASGAAGALYVATLADVRLATAPSGAASPAERYAAGRDDLQYEVLTSLDAQAEVTLLEVLGDALYLGTREGGLRILSPATAGANAQTWVAATGLRGLTLHSLCALPGSSQELFAGTSAGLYASNDAGATWYKAGAVLGDAPVLSLCAPAALPGVVLSGVAQAGVWISRDAGVTWARYGAGLGRLDVLSLLLDERVAPGVLYAGTSDGLWRLPMGQD